MDRRYTDDEVAAVLGRAAEMQAQDQARAAGPTLAELEEIARQAGIDPAAVRRAAASLDDKQATRAGAEAVAATSEVRDGGELRFEIDGVLDDAGREAVVAIVERELGRGTTLSTPSQRTFTLTAPLHRAVAVRITSAEGRTLVVVSDLAPIRHRPIAAAITLSLGVPAIAAALAATAGNDMSTIVAAAAGVAAAVASAGVGYGVSRLNSRAHHRMLAKIVEETRNAVAANARVTPVESESALEAARAHQGLSTTTPATPSTSLDASHVAEHAVDVARRR